MKTRYQIKTIKVQLRVEESVKTQLSSPEAAGGLAREILKKLDADQEHCILLALNVQNEVVGFKVIASGAMDQVTIDPKILFRSALLLGAAGIILVHNHPSGHTDPSEEDKILTRTVKDGARLLGIRLLDHLIIGRGEHYSFTTQGLL